MTVAELIAELQKLDPDMPVVVRGWEWDLTGRPEHAEEVSVKERSVSVAQCSGASVCRPTAFIT